MKKILFNLLFVASNIFGQNTTEVVPARDHTYEYEQEGIPFAVIEQIPLFPSCEKVEKTAQRECFYEQMQFHIKKNLKTPSEAENESQVIRVIVQFQIDKEGKVINITTRRSNFNGVYEAEVKRVIEKLPKFIPGTHKGKAVITSYALPINFSTK
jgi:protein TonB